MQIKSTEDYPTVGDRLNLQHTEYNQISINTEIVEYHHLELAICRSTVTTNKGTFTGSGVASIEKDRDMVTSLLEIAETRAVSRALRFSGALVEHTGREEVPKSSSNKTSPSGNISKGQKRAIERMSKEHGWNIIEAIRRILGKRIETVDSLNKQDASTVIQRMKAVIKAA